jgi:hypothetical protein
MSSQVPEESKDKYGSFDDEFKELSQVSWDKACEIAAEIEKNRPQESEEERLWRICTGKGVPR